MKPLRFFLLSLVFLCIGSKVFADSFVINYSNNKRLYKWDGTNLINYSNNKKLYKWDGTNISNYSNNKKLYKLNGNTVVHHTSFDRIALDKACDKYDLPRFDVEWVDSAKIVRKALPQFSKSGYGLKNVANHFGYMFKHHDALNDALACAFITLRCNEVMVDDKMESVE